MAGGELELDGRKIEAKYAVAREEIKREAQQQVTGQVKTSKLFVGGLSIEVTEEEFRTYFEKFGRVKEASIISDHTTNRSRGFGFITYGYFLCVVWLWTAATWVCG